MTRLDAALVARGLTTSRSQARQLVQAGAVKVNGRRVTKPAQRVGPKDQLDVEDSLARYVGRGARKLIGALDAFGVDPAGLVALDVGSSTGGFTQVLLERDAEQVIAVDVGTDQLVDSLREHPRLRVYEGTDVRALRRSDLPAPAQLVVVDVSFISVRLLVPAISELSAAKATAVVLVKPQFEAGQQALDGRGVVHDRQVMADVVVTVVREFVGAAWQPLAVAPCVVTGSAGNQEFFVRLQRSGATRMADTEIAATVLGH